MTIKDIPESAWWPQDAGFQVYYAGNVRSRRCAIAARHKAPLQVGQCFTRIQEEIYKAYKLVLSDKDEFYYYFT